jgi:syntaxin 5
LLVPCNLRPLLLVCPSCLRLTIALSASSPLYNTVPRPHSAQAYVKPSRSQQPDLLQLNINEEESIGMHPQSQQMQLVQQQDTYLSQRGQAIESIESTIHELGSIFQQLAQMVSEQADTVQR